MTLLFERLAARAAAIAPLAVPGLQLVPRGAIALAEHVNRYYRVLHGTDPENVAVRLPTGGGSFEVRHSATNAALLRVTDAGLDFPPAGIGTVELADGSVTSAKILDNEIVNADINAAAAIAVAKLAHVGANNVLRSNGAANVGGQVATADIADGQVTSLKILDGTILNVDVNAAAAIAYGKLALANSIVNADIAPAGTAQIAVNKLLHVGAGNVLRSDGAQNVPGQVVTGDIADGTILNVDINAAANINGSKLLDNSVTSAKLAGGIAVGAGTITTTEIADGTILNIDVSPTAAIALAKLAPGTAGVLKSNGTAISAGNLVATADLVALSLSQAVTLVVGPSANQSWSSTVAFQPVNQCTVTLTGCLASSYYLVFGAFGATHSVANGRNQARIWCATSGAMLGWFSPSMGNATAGLQFAHSIVAFGQVAASGSITFELHAAQVEAGTTQVAANTGFLMAVELRRGGS